MVVKMDRAHFPLFLLFIRAILTANYVVTLSFTVCKRRQKNGLFGNTTAKILKKNTSTNI